METLTYTFNLPATVASPALYTPVILPLGPLTIAPLKAASLGVLVPFVIFVLVLFAYKYGVWHENTSAYTGGGGRTSSRGGRSRRGYNNEDAPEPAAANTQQSFFRAQQRNYGRLVPTASRPSFFSR